MSILNIHRFNTTPQDSLRIREMVGGLLRGRECAPLDDILQDIPLLTQELPRSVREMARSFKRHEKWHVICIAGDLYEPESVPATPLAHRAPNEIEQAFSFDVVHLMFAHLLGEPFAWTSIQNGYMINDVMPVEAHRGLIASSGTDTVFDLHTEDAFHTCAGDYLGLLCLKNPDAVPTTLTCPDLRSLSEHSVEVLFQPRFIVGANLAQSVSEVVTPSPILWGSPDSPYFRINVNRVACLEGDAAAQSALDELIDHLRSVSTQVAFNPGEFWYIDNYRVAHGRGRYTATFGGDDRWLRRLYITSNVRGTAPFRRSSSTLLLDPAPSRRVS